MDQRDFVRSPEQLSLLLVESTPHKARLYQSLLSKIENFELEIFHVSSLVEAHSHLKRSTYDVILLDLELPNTNGLSAVRALVAEWPAVPVIVVVAGDENTAAVESLRCGARDYLIEEELTPSMLGRAIRYAVEQHQTWLALQENKARYELAIAAINEGIFDWDLCENRISFSARWCELLGYQPDQLGDEPGEWLDRVHLGDWEKISQILTQCIEGQIERFEAEHRVLCQDGVYRWMLVRGVICRDQNDSAVRLVGSFSDITKSKKIEAQLAFIANRDRLTGLANRAYFEKKLNECLAIQYKDDPRFTVFSLDIDKFRAVNDGLGHAIGDRMLNQAGTRLRQVVFQNLEDAVLARLGDDEFAVLLPYQLDEVQIASVARALLYALKEPFVIEGEEVYITGSMGVVLDEGSYHSSDEVLRDANTAIYQAKLAGGDRYYIFEVAMRFRVHTFYNTAMELYRAFNNQEFEAWFQPIVDLYTGQIVGFESLIRWHHPRRGVLSPKEFLPIAAEIGLLAQIDRWMIRQSALHLGRWQKTSNNPSLWVSVNLSHSVLREPRLVDYLETVLLEAEIEASSLKLEITEDVAFCEDFHVLRVLQALRARGFSLAIDDFGTGYSSLQAFHLYPVDTLKIDQTFIQAMDPNQQRSTKVVRTVLELAREWGIETVAEGIESSQYIPWLRLQGCRYGQGSLFSLSVPANQAELLLQEGRRRVLD